MWSAQLNRIEANQVAILAALKALQGSVGMAVLDLTNLTAAVAQETTVDASALALINGFGAQLTAALAAGTPQATVDAVTALNAQLVTDTTALAAAVAANTSAAPGAAAAAAAPAPAAKSS